MLQSPEKAEPPVGERGAACSSTDCRCHCPASLQPGLDTPLDWAEALTLRGSQFPFHLEKELGDQSEGHPSGQQAPNIVSLSLFPIQEKVRGIAQGLMSGPTPRLKH